MSKLLSFKQFASIAEVIEEDVVYEQHMNILSEELHHELQQILDQDSPSDAKLSLVTKHVRDLIKTGQDTGLDSDKPKKGSSRAVFFPKEPKKIILDGRETYVPTAVKIAFPGKLDKYTGSDILLGEHQNRLEMDRDANYHSTIRKVGHNTFETNPNGVLAPVISSHPDGHYIEMGLCGKYNSKDLRSHTKHPDFKSGLSHAQIQEHLEDDYRQAHGEQRYRTFNESLSEHPHVNHMIMAMHDIGLHPGDLRPTNMGIWTHPHTGHKHPVVLDYGFSTEIAKLYFRARQKMFRRNF